MVWRSTPVIRQYEEWWYLSYVEIEESETWHAWEWPSLIFSVTIHRIAERSLKWGELAMFLVLTFCRTDVWVVYHEHMCVLFCLVKYENVRRCVKINRYFILAINYSVFVLASAPRSSYSFALSFVCATAAATGSEQCPPPFTDDGQTLCRVLDSKREWLLMLYL